MFKHTTQERRKEKGERKKTKQFEEEKEKDKSEYKVTLYFNQSYYL